MKFDAQLISALVRLLVAGLDDEPSFEIQTEIASSINNFCEFMHTRLSRKPTDKSLFLVQCVKRYFDAEFPTVKLFLQNLTYLMVFGDCKNIWLFQKSYHAALALVALREQPQQVVWDVIAKHEGSEERLKKLSTELECLFKGLNLGSLESKSREHFSTNFNTFKNFLNDFNNT